MHTIERLLGLRATSLLFVITVVLISYPHLANFTATAVTQGAWELHDSLSAEITVVPGQRVVRQELLNHHQLLWSNLRMGGLPLLAGEIQGAPLFPLTLLCIALPDAWYWNVTALLRLVLIGFGTMLIAREVLKFRWLGSVVFLFSFGYGLTILQFLNHPWQNGFLATVWYIYFLARVIERDGEGNVARLPLVFGLAFSANSLITAGFPESTTMGALLVLLVFITPTLKLIFTDRPRFFDIVIAHAIGVLFASWQLLPMLELVSKEWQSYRGHPGLNQWPTPGLLLHMVARISNEPHSVGIRHLFNLLPISFFLFFFIFTLARVRKLDPWDKAALICLTFAVFKLFPIWPAWNLFIGTLPLLMQSHYTVFYFPIFLWGFAHFAARGADYLFADADKLPAHSVAWLTANIGTLVLLYFACRHSVLPVQSGYLLRSTLPWVILFLSPFIFAKRRSWKNGLTSVAILLLIFEHLSMRPPFLKAATRLSDRVALGDSLPEWLKARGLPISQLRNRGTTADYVHVGVADADGAYALIPERLSVLRSILFDSVGGETDVKRLFQVERERLEHAWHYLSGSLITMSRSQFANLELEQKRDWILLGEQNDLVILKDPKALPRAFIPAKCIPVQNLQEAKEGMLKGLPATPTVFLEISNRRDQEFCRSFSSALQEISILEDRGNQLKLGVVQGPTIVAVNDSWFAGWTARDLEAGEELEIHGSNIAFRGLILPQNKSYTILMEYHPTWLNLAIGGSVLGCLLALLLIFISVRRRDKVPVMGGSF